MAEHDDTTAAPSKTTPKNNTHSKKRSELAVAATSSAPQRVPMAAAGLPALAQGVQLAALERELAEFADKILGYCSEWDGTKYRVTPTSDLDYLRRAVANIEEWRQSFAAVDRPASVDEIQIQVTLLTAGFPNLARSDLDLFAAIAAAKIAKLQPTAFELTSAADAVVEREFLTIAAVVTALKAARDRAQRYRQALQRDPRQQLASAELEQRQTRARRQEEKEREQRRAAAIAARAAEEERVDRKWEAFRAKLAERVAQLPAGQLQEERRADQARWVTNQRQAEQDFKENMARLGDAASGLAKLLKEQRQECDEDWVQREDRQAREERDAFMAKLLKEGDSATSLANFDIDEMLERRDQQQESGRLA
jgi:hypothetical protein